MNDDELTGKFWAQLRRADADQSRLAFGLETRVLARLREPRPLSLMQLAARFCFGSLCAALLLALWLPGSVNALEFSELVDAAVSDSGADMTIFFNGENSNGET